MTEKNNKFSVRLDHFRSHEKATFRFHCGGSTYLRGQNGSGKSDIYRAICWALYGKETKLEIYSPGHKGTTTVTLTHRDFTAYRQARSFSLSVTIGDENYRESEAQAEIVKRYGTFEQWELSSYITQSSRHLFIEATKQSRMSILNRLIQITNEPVERIAKCIAKYKEKANTEKVRSEEQKKAHRKKYGKEINDKAFAITTDKEITKTEKEIGELVKSITVLEKEMTRKEILEKNLSEKEKICKSVEKEGVFTKDGYEELRKSFERYSKYATNLKAFTSFSAKFSSPPYCYTEDDRKRVAKENEEYSYNSKLAKKYEVEYNLGKIEEKITFFSSAIDDYDKLQLKDAYAKQKLKVDKLIKQLETMTRVGNDEVEKLNKLILSYPTYLLYCKYQDQQKELEKYKNELGEYVDAKRVIELKEAINSQWKFDKLDRYLALLERFGFNKEIGMEELKQQCESLKCDLRDAKLSSKISICPSCDAKLIVCKEELKLYNGKLFNDGDVKALTEKITNYEKAIEAFAPPIPEGLERIDKAKSEKICELYSKYSNIVHLPKPEFDIAMLEECKKWKSIDGIKDRKKECEKYLSNEAIVKEQTAILEAMPNPEIEIHNKRCELSKEVMIERMKNLREIVVLNKPISPDEIENSIRYYTLSEKVGEEVNKVTETELENYSKKLRDYENAFVAKKSIEEDLVKIVATKSEIKKLRSEKDALSSKLEAAIYQNEYLASKKKCEKKEAVYTKRKVKLAHVEEYKKIYLAACQKVTKSTIYTIEKHVNSTLSAVLTNGITVSLSLEDNSKLNFQFQKFGINYGDCKELSGGEKSILSFALILAFNSITNSSVMLLDEATEGLSLDRKDECIEMLLDYIGKYFKTLLLTDHFCHSGDYDKIISLTTI